MKLIERRKFKTWIYTVSHRVLILRSELQYPDVEYDNPHLENCTLDLEFSGVFSMSVIQDFILHSITVSKAIGLTDYELHDEEYLLFKLHHDKGVSIIIAESCVLGKSQWSDMDRITYPELMYDEYEVILP